MIKQVKRRCDACKEVYTMGEDGKRQGKLLFFVRDYSMRGASDFRYYDKSANGADLCPECVEKLENLIHGLGLYPKRKLN